MVGRVNIEDIYTNRIGFSLLEIIIVLVVLGVILTFAIPSYDNSLKKGRNKNAEFNLIVIYNAQKRHKLDNGVYYGCGESCTSALINENLDLDVLDPYFDYKIVSDSGEQFKAYATSRDSERCYMVTQSGSEISQECDL